MESRRVSETVHGRGWGDCPQRKSSRDPTLSGSHSRNEAAGVCRTSLDIFMIKPRKECFLKTPTVNSFSCWHYLAYPLSKIWNCVCIGSANSAIFCNHLHLHILSFISTRTARTVNRLLSKPLCTIQCIYYLWAAVLICLVDVTHTYICAMCACSIVNSSASKNVFQAVEKALRNSPFSYQGARILSGQEEGAFGWVTVNYLDDRLKQVSMCTSTYRSVHICPHWDVLCVCQYSRFCTDQVLFYLFCRAWKQQALLTLAGRLLKLALYPMILTAQSHRSTLSTSDSMEMIITCILTASCATEKTKR